MKPRLHLMAHGLMACTLSVIALLAPVSQAYGASVHSESGDEIYTIVPNDTLWWIAQRYGITTAQLLAANPGINPDLLRIGQSLRIPVRGPAQMAGAAHGTSYTVQAGDIPMTIAARFGVSVAALLAANPGVEPRRLRIGQTLRIPGEGQPSLQPAPAETPIAPDAPAVDQPPAQPAPAAEAEINPMALEMLDRLNEKRLAGGLPALQWNAQLAAAAQAHAEDCAQRKHGSHIGSDGARLKERLQRAGYPAIWSGENWANARNVEHAVALWWNEPAGADPHVQNIMAARATEIGIGVAYGAWGWYFIADFGSR